MDTTESEQLREPTKEEQFVEKALLEHTASQNWEQIQSIEWTSAEVIDVIGKALANARGKDTASGVRVNAPVKCTEANND